MPTIIIDENYDGAEYNKATGYYDIAGEKQFLENVIFKIPVNFLDKVDFYADVNALKSVLFSEDSVVFGDLRVAGDQGSKKHLKVYGHNTVQEDVRGHDIEVHGNQWTGGASHNTGNYEIHGTHNVSLPAKVYGDYTCVKQSTFDSDAIMLGNVKTGGLFSVDGTLKASQKVESMDGMKVKNFSFIDGKVRVLGTVTLKENAYFGDDVDITESLHITKNIKTSKSLNLGGDLDVKGDIDLGGDTKIRGKTNAGGSITSGEDLTLIGQTTAGGDITSEGTIITLKELITTGRVTAGKMLILNDISRIDGGVTTGDDFIQHAHAHIKGDSMINGSHESHEVLIADGNHEVKKNFTASKEIRFAKDLDVGGKFSPMGLTNIGNNLKTKETEALGMLVVKNNNFCENDFSALRSLFVLNDHYVGGNESIVGKRNISNNDDVVGIQERADLPIFCAKNNKAVENVGSIAP